MSRHQALKQWHGRQVVDELATGDHRKSPSSRGVAEEAPGAYKDTPPSSRRRTRRASPKVATLEPVICIKG